MPAWLWWLAMPVGLLGAFFITPRIKPLSATQLVFTYVIPILPLLIAWDGAVSNARTYSQDDLRQLADDAGLSMLEAHRALHQLIDRKIVDLVDDCLIVQDFEALTACLDALKREGIDKAHIHILNSNAAARAWWLNRGFFLREEVTLFSFINDAADDV